MGINYTCVLSFTSMHATISKLRSNSKEKCLRLILLVVVMETIKYICTLSFTFMSLVSVRSEEVILRKVPKAVFVGNWHGRFCTHVYQVSPPCVLY